MVGGGWGGFVLGWVGVGWWVGWLWEWVVMGVGGK